MFRSFLTLALLAFSGLIFGQGVNNGWTNWWGLKITEHAGEGWKDHQVLLNLDLESLVANGEIEPDGSDLRFSSDCDGAVSLNYWIEDGTFTDTTQIWVLLDTLAPNEEKFIYMFGGNPGVAAASDFDATFDPTTRLLVETGNTYTPTANEDYSWIEIEAGATISLAATTAATTPFVPVFTARKIIMAGDVVLDQAGGIGGDINGADGTGPGNGLGNTGGGGSGGGHGSAGAQGRGVPSGSPAAGGNAYPGGLTNDYVITMGSGGGASVGAGGGTGGGSIVFEGTFVDISGSLSMNGSDGVGATGTPVTIGGTINGIDPGGAGGAGSGGGMFVLSRRTLFTGGLTANGGTGGVGTDPANGGGDGGGGLVKIFKETLVNSATISTAGNGGGAVLEIDSIHFPSGELLEKIPYPIDYVFDILNTDSLCKGVEYSHNAIFNSSVSRFDSIRFWVNSVPVLSDPFNSVFLYDGIEDGDEAYFTGEKYGCIQFSDTITFGVFDLPSATWEVADIVGETEYTFEVTSSTGNIGNQIWSFGDGSFSSDLNPTHTFGGRGVYTTCLVVSDADTKCSSKSICKDLDVVCTDPDIKYEFLFENVDYKIILNDTTARAQEWEWSLEGGPFVANNSDTIFTYHKDTTGVMFDLAVRNHCSVDTLFNQTFDVGCAPLVPNVDFVQSNDDAFQYQIVDQSDFTPIDWEVVIGNDTIFAGFPSMPYEFPGKGTYNIEYTIVNACADSLTTNIAFSPDCPNPDIEWDYQFDNENPLLVHFNNEANNKFGPELFWFFDDQNASQNTTSSLSNPTHLFEGGDKIYNVYLRISNQCGDTTLSKEIAVCDSVSSGFGFVEGKDNEVSFSNISYGSSVQTTWFFGTGDSLVSNTANYQFPEESGTYDVCLRTINLCQDTSIYCEEITLCNNLTAAFETQWDDRTILLANLSEGDYNYLKWDLGNGVIVENDEFIAYTYPPVDHSYTVCLTVENECGEVSSDCEFYVVLGIEDEFELEEFAAMPNPFSDELTLSFPSSNEVEIRIITAEGRLIETYHNFKGELTVNTAEWAKGMYFIEAQNKSASKVIKLVK